MLGPSSKHGGIHQPEQELHRYPARWLRRRSGLRAEDRVRELRQITVERPQNLRVDLTQSDGDKAQLIYDGREISFSSSSDNIYSITSKPGSLDDAVKYLVKDLKLRLPLAMMLLSDFPAELEQRVTAADYVEFDTITTPPATMWRRAPMPSTFRFGWPRRAIRCHNKSSSPTNTKKDNRSFGRSSKTGTSLLPSLLPCSLSPLPKGLKRYRSWLICGSLSVQFRRKEANDGFQDLGQKCCDSGRPDVSCLLCVVEVDAQRGGGGAVVGVVEVDAAVVQVERLFRRAWRRRLLRGWRF